MILVKVCICHLDLTNSSAYLGLIAEARKPHRVSFTGKLEELFHKSSVRHLCTSSSTAYSISPTV